jgi:hypothetical protein
VSIDDLRSLLDAMWSSWGSLWETSPFLFGLVVVFTAGITLAVVVAAINFLREHDEGPPHGH